MTAVRAYWRPVTVDEAVTLLQRPNAVLIGGGAQVNASLADRAAEAGPVEIIDLQALRLDARHGLERIEPRTDYTVAIGALVTLQRIADDSALPAGLCEAARREQPSALRNVVTIGGCVAGRHWESEFLATLLACDAVVTFTGPGGERTARLTALLADSGQLAGAVITTVSVAADGVISAARTARTAADRPIVAAVARRAADGTRLALSGVAAVPILLTLTGADGMNGRHKPRPDRQALKLLDPPGDFRGSPGYRRALAAVLAVRALAATG
ncbi:MAG: FAD binding domain-containing protein [Streptosporangiaceae bacterium]